MASPLAAQIAPSYAPPKPAGKLLRLPIHQPRPSAQELIRQFSQLKSQRSNWESHWQEVKDRVWPHSADFNTRRSSGTKRTEEMLDASAALALEKFAAALESLLTPRQQQWHKLQAMDEELADDPQVKAWLELATKWLFRVRAAPGAGYYAHAHEGYKSLGAYGNTCMFVEAHSGGGLRYSHVPIAKAYVALNQFGAIDTIFKCYRMTAKQAFQTWGERAPEKARQTLASNPWQELEYLHVVRPNGWRDPQAIGPRGMAWESVHLCLDSQEIIDIGGYAQLPYLFSRYTVNPDESYGRGPAMLVLSNIKILQEQQKTFLRAGHKLVDPPLLVHDEGVLGTGGKVIRLTPGGVNYGGVNAAGRPLIQALQTGGRLDLTFEMMERERETINEAFLVTLFQILVQNPQMTATEALIRAQEKGQLLAPAVGRQQSELLGPQIHRELWLGLNSGELPPPPEELTSYEVEYESPATQYQKAATLVAIQRTVEVAAPGLQADPGLMQKFKWDKIIDEAASAQGVPLELIRTEEEYAEARAAYDQAQAAQQAIAMGQGVAAGVKDMAAAAPMMQQAGAAGAVA